MILGCGNAYISTSIAEKGGNCMHDRITVQIKNSEVLQLFVEDLIANDVDHMIVNDGGNYKVVMYTSIISETEYQRLKKVFEKGIVAQEKLLELRKQGLY